MTIAAGDRIPSATLYRVGEKGPEPVSTDDIFSGKRVVLFAVPAAFSPGCSQTHMPGFVINADEILSKGVDQIACVAVNDAFVMNAWGKDQNADQLTMLSDGNAEFAGKIGLDMDASRGGMGTRSKRYALIADDGVVQWIGVDDKGVDKSSAESVLANL